MAVKRKLAPSIAARNAPRCVLCTNPLCPGESAHMRVPPGTPPGSFRSFEQLALVPMSEWSDREATEYVAFVFESAAHLAGGFGALTPRHCLALAARVRRVGGSK